MAGIGAIAGNYQCSGESANGTCEVRCRHTTAECGILNTAAGKILACPGARGSIARTGGGAG